MAADTDKELTESVHFDLFIIVGDSYESQQNANKLAKILVTFCARCCSDRLTVFPELQLGGNRLKNLRNGLKHSTYRLIFIDDGFEESHFVRFETDAALMEMIVNRDQSIIPVKAHSQILIPSLLRMFKPLDVSRLLKGKRLEDIDIELMTEADIEKPLVEGIVRMLNRSGSVRQSNSEPSLGAVSKHSELLQRHYKYLSEWMDPDGGLIPALYSADVINRREMETISAEKTSFDRNEHLVRTLQRKSEANFRKFIEVLQTEEQSHIAEQLGFGASQASKRAVNR